MIYSTATFEFLTDLAANNNREWFAANKTRYLADVLAPSLSLISLLEKPLRRVAPFLNANPTRTGGSLTRIYRDTRFAKDKTPYKTNVGIQLRHQAGKDIHAPGFYIHISAEECFLGAGCYHPEPAALAKIRAAIASDGKGWMKARNDRKFSSSFELWGDSLKTAPRDYEKNHPLIDDLRRKDFLGLAPITRQQVLNDDLVSIIIEHVRSSRSLMKFLCEAIQVPY